MCLILRFLKSYPHIKKKRSATERSVRFFYFIVEDKNKNVIVNM